MQSPLLLVFLGQTFNFFGTAPNNSSIGTSPIPIPYAKSDLIGSHADYNMSVPSTLAGKTQETTLPSPITMIFLGRSTNFFGAVPNNPLFGTRSSPTSYNNGESIVSQSAQNGSVGRPNYTSISGEGIHTSRSSNNFSNVSININQISTKNNTIENEAESTTRSAYQMPYVFPTLASDYASTISTTESGSQITTTRTDTSTAVDLDEVSTLSDHYKIVCYFPGGGLNHYQPDNIGHTLCTHIVLQCAILNSSNLKIQVHPTFTKSNNEFLPRLYQYKQRGFKVLLGVGGWSDSMGDKYSRLVGNSVNRRKFVRDALLFVEGFGFDGLDFDWEWPVCWQADCGAGPETDKEGFSLLMEELNSALKPRGLLFTAVIAQNKVFIDEGFDVPVIAKYLDWISVVTYDYHGAFAGDTGHMSPLYDPPGFYDDRFNVNYTINYLISKGAPSRKIVMGMPFYGRSFTIRDPNNGIALNAPAAGPGEAGEVSKSAGFLTYHEICDRIHNHNWNVVRDPQHHMGPYAYKGNQWVGFDDADTVRQKAQYIKDMNLGGGMVKSLDYDDYEGKCGEGVHPLMNAFHEVLADSPIGQVENRKIPPPIIHRN